MYHGHHPNATYGCISDRTTSMWVRAGCRGNFFCAGRSILCGDWRNPSMTCACEKVLERVPSTRARTTSRPPPKATTLLVVMVADSSQETQARILGSMKYVDGSYPQHRAHVDWAVAAYDDRAPEWNVTRSMAVNLLTTKLISVVDVSSGRPFALTAPERKARLAHQLLVLKVALGTNSTYHAVWLPDHDLSFVEFDLAEWLRRWLCSFERPPVIAQPPLRSAIRSKQVGQRKHPKQTGTMSKKVKVIHGLTKPFQNDIDTWNTCVVGELTQAGMPFANRPCFLRDALGLRTAFIEGQAAFVDAAFLRWFIGQPIVQKIAALQLKMGVEAGPDAIWCGAAAEWAAMQQQSDASRRPRQPCAVLTVPITHDDTRSLMAKTSSHVESSFALLYHARIRRHLRWSLGENPKCYRHACAMHRWFLYQPSPNWRLPEDEEGLKEVAACVVSHETSNEQCRAMHDRPWLPGHDAALAPSLTPTRHCDGLFKLYWRSHEY